MNRRSFVLGAAASAAVRLAAADRIRIGVIGTGGRGRLLISEFAKQGVEVAAVCDVYEPHLEAARKAASAGAAAFGDYRRLLDDKTLDAVVVASPDHWHARMAIDAVSAGKDVYLEKPLAHTVEEGFQIVEAVRRTKRVVQVGMQRRSFDLFQQARRVMESGALGDVRLVNGWWVNHQATLGTRPFEGKVDWERWLGSAPRRDLDPKRFFGWYYFWDYSGGLMVGQAAHVIDAIHWLMGSTYPTAVTCAGGQVNIEGAEIPETTCMSVEYPGNYLAVFTVGYKAMRYHTHNDQLIQFHGSKARFDVGRESYALYPQSSQIAMKASAEEDRPGGFVPATGTHIANFLECLRSRKEPNAPVEAANSTNVVLCMAVEALRSGRRVVWDAARRRASQS